MCVLCEGVLCAYMMVIDEKRFLPSKNGNNCRANVALSGEVEISYCRACLYVVQYIHNSVMRRRFYGLDLKKEMLVFENKPWRLLD